MGASLLLLLLLLYAPHCAGCLLVQLPKCFRLRKPLRRCP
jgi:hypothetical protein